MVKTVVKTHAQFAITSNSLIFKLIGLVQHSYSLTTHPLDVLWFAKRSVGGATKKLPRGFASSYHFLFRHYQNRSFLIQNLSFFHNLTIMSGNKVDIPRSIRLQKKVWEVKDASKIAWDCCKYTVHRSVFKTCFGLKYALFVHFKQPTPQCIRQQKLLLVPYVLDFKYLNCSSVWKLTEKVEEYRWNHSRNTSPSD